MGNLRIAGLRFNALEVLIPLAFGAQAALLFAPDDEPALELLLAAPRPLAWVIYERLIALALIQGGVALIGSLLVLSLPDAEAPVTILIRWFAPTVCVTGVCIWATLATRKISHGILVAVMLVGAMAVGHEILVPRYPEMRWIMFYVQPWDITPDEYAINRAILIIVGVIAFALAIRMTRDTENMLGTKQRN
jgi:hypothetical protein